MSKPCRECGHSANLHVRYPDERLSCNARPPCSCRLTTREGEAWTAELKRQYFEGDNNEVIDRVYATRYDCPPTQVAPATPVLASLLGCAALAAALAPSRTSGAVSTPARYSLGPNLAAFGPARVASQSGLISHITEERP